MIALFLIIPLSHGSEKVSFGQDFTTCLTRDFLWTQLNASLVQSKNIGLWPQNKSKVTGTGIGQPGKIRVTYNLSFFLKPSYSYSVGSVVPYETFTYTAMKGHPFRGGAQITLMDLPNRKTLLRWRGFYIVANMKIADGFSNFAKEFFNELGERVKYLEQQNCNN